MYGNHNLSQLVLNFCFLNFKFLVERKKKDPELDNHMDEQTYQIALIFFIQIAQRLKFVLGKYSTCRDKNIKV